MSRRAVVMAAPGRSGSTTVAHFAFGQTSGFELWYEPCRADGSESYDLGRSSSSQPWCAQRVARVLSCTLAFEDFQQLLADRSAILQGTHVWLPAEGENKRWSNAQNSTQATLQVSLYQAWMRSCWKCHSAAKVIRLDNAHAPIDATSSSQLRARMRSIVLLRHPASVARSRLAVSGDAFRSVMLSHNPSGGSLGVATAVCSQLMTLLRHGADLVVQMESFLVDPLSQLQLIYHAIGLAEAQSLALRVHKNALSNPCGKARNLDFLPRYPGSSSLCGNSTGIQRSTLKRLAVQQAELELQLRQGPMWEHLQYECGGQLSSHYYPNLQQAGRTRLEQLSIPLLERLVPVQQHKLLFCLIDKNAITAQSILVADLQGMHGKVDELLVSGLVSWKDFPWTYAARGQLMSLIASPEQHIAIAEERLNSSDWRKLVVLRHPVERFISAYRSKCETELELKDSHGHGEVRCRSIFKLGPDEISMRTIAERLHLGSFDPHWAPQSSFCGGLSRSISNFKRVMFGNMTSEIPSYLRSLGLSEEAVRRSDTVLRREYKPDRFEDTDMQHMTHSSLQTSSAAQMDAETLQLVERFYREDFILLGLPLSSQSQSASPDVAAQRGRSVIVGGASASDEERAVLASFNRFSKQRAAALAPSKL